MKAPRVIPGISLGAGILAFFSCCATAEESPSITSAFAATTVQITAMPDAMKVPVEWSFTNHGDIPLAIEKFIESCGCLSGNMTPQAADPTAPGKSGVVRASFTPGQHRGLLRKSLHVRFVGHEEPVELVVEAQIHATVRLSRQELTWESNESNESSNASVTEIIDVITDTDTPFAITGLLGVPESQFRIVQQTITPDKHYQLHITPADSHPASSVSAALQLRTNSPDPRDQVLILLLSQSAIPR